MNYTALSLSQAPPLSVPLRFFLTAPLFVAAAALTLLLADDTALASRWTPMMLALTHLITLGFLTSCMVGALQQLLPVLIGTPIPSPRRVATLLYLPLTLGCIALVAGMGLSQPGLLQLGALLLLSALLPFIAVITRGLWRTCSRHATVTAMWLALTSLLLLLAIALWLLWRGRWQLPLAHPVTSLHVAWAALGWVGMLLIGVAYQVVPMFQITPEYPLKLRRWLLPAVGLLLLCWSLTALLLPGVTTLLGHLLALCFMLFALQTLWLQERRRRRLADVTLNFWRLAMASLTVSALLWMVMRWNPWGQGEPLLGVLFLLGFAYSAVNGMLYKIVPFLVWLHLNNRLQARGSWQGGVPHMKQIIGVPAMRRQFLLHLFALGGLLLAFAFPSLMLHRVVAGLWLLNALYLWWNLWQAVRCYRHTLQTAATATPG